MSDDFEEGKKIHKQVAIQDLPFGYVKEQLLKIAASPETKVIVVASYGYVHDWSCYIGWPLELNMYGKMMDDTGYYREAFKTWQGVAMHGDKLSRTEANILFPEVPVELHYRS
jgi:hypothetical protein